MGYGSYSAEAHRAITAERAALPQKAVFLQNDCHPSMNPRGVKKRECRDSAQHPDSVGIVFALDVSGSMGVIPEQLATKTLPSFFESVLPVLPHPQVLFIAFGNAYSDKSPLQVGQFESEAKLIDHWLRTSHLEGEGGGLGESYDLAMYLAARHTSMDCLEKRGRKGYFFMTGDEPPFAWLNPSHVSGLIGGTLAEQIEIQEITSELLRSFHTFFLIPDAARAAQYEVGAIWGKLLHERSVVLATAEDTAVACALLIAITEGAARDQASLEKTLETQFKRTGAERDRVVKAVLPYALALARGPIAGPEKMGTRTDTTGLKG